MHTSTWDDWLVTRTPTGDQYADGVARIPLQALDFSAAGTRDGLRQLFAEFEEATAGQQIVGSSLDLPMTHGAVEEPDGETT